MERVNAQATFTDLTVADLGGPRAKAFFDTCRQQIPFDQLAASVADVFTLSAVVYNFRRSFTLRPAAAAAT